MMIPPLVRVGYPLEPEPLVEYVCLVRHRGWQILCWRPDLGFHAEDILYPGSNGLIDVIQVHDHDILCWMPQDGT